MADSGTVIRPGNRAVKHTEFCMSDVVFYHMRERNGDKINPCGGHTICYSLDRRRFSYEMSIARCSLQDIYVKHVGVDLAFAKYKAGQTIRIPASYYTDQYGYKRLWLPWSIYMELVDTHYVFDLGRRSNKKANKRNPFYMFYTSTVSKYGFHTFENQLLSIPGM